MRLTEFWRRMHEHFGEMRADSLARDHVFSDLGGRTVLEALDAAMNPKVVWRAVCADFDVPVAKR